MRLSDPKQKFVDLNVSVRVPLEVYNFLRDFYALGGKTVEEVLADDLTNLAVFCTLDEIRGMDHENAIIEKYGLGPLMKGRDC